MSRAAGHRDARSRGLATVMALSMIVFVGAALVAMSAELGRVALRHRLAATDLQLHQMLTAGGKASSRLVRERVQAAAGEEAAILNIALPEELVQRGGRLTLRARSAAAGLEQQVAVEARLEGRAARQTLRYGKTLDGWALIEARLEE